ncbi:MAG TPA: bifunctional riboflavin kinase/FAD synthetase [Dehalococcoidales bacterium]|nr:bifunctional riboflavin kinase/FAD synthetase [Dehalococcoidales bacterium]
MLIEHELGVFAPNCDSLVTIGVFDGVHLGHRYLIYKLKELAGQQSLCTVALTFNTHPQEILNPVSQPPLLTDAVEKAALLQKEGLNGVIVLTFTPELSRLSSRQFVDLLRSKLRMKGLVIGPDFALGRGAEGNIPALRKMGRELGFSVTVIPPVKMNGEIISSTVIRQAMADGNMEKVRRLMGRPFSLRGKVIKGYGRGSGLGFPTVNLSILPGKAMPPDGVYATFAQTRDKTYHSVTNIGVNPTFGNQERTVEAYLLDFRDNLYEQEVKINFIHKLRHEIKFAGPDELVKQIYKDIKEAREVLRNLNPDI